MGHKHVKIESVASSAMSTVPVVGHKNFCKKQTTNEVRPNESENSLLPHQHFFSSLLLAILD